MISVTKVFHFETAHAVHGYNGSCGNVHGHSYQLYVTVVNDNENGNGFISDLGFVIDFKDMKKIVSGVIDNSFDHKLILSKKFLEVHPEMSTCTNLISWEVEPSAENMLIFFSQELKALLPNDIRLLRLKLFETKDSFAEWES